MAIDTACDESLGLMQQTEYKDWLDKFLSSGCIFSASPNSVWIGWGDVRRSRTFSESRLSLFAPDFLLADSRPWHLFEFSAEVDIERLSAMLKSKRDTPGSARELAQIKWEQPSYAEFHEVFRDIQARIARHELSKAVPVISRIANLEVDSAMRLQALINALNIARRSPLQPYGIWDSEGEGMIGATPELLFEQLSERKVETMALAGTRRNILGEPSLLSDSKEVHEHRIVVDGILDRLGKLGEVAVGETQEVRLPALIHLRTAIAAQATRDVEFSDWVEALHPTPAIGAWPFEAGWKWLRSQSNAETRRRFGAPFGLIPPGNSFGRCLVAIRNVQWTADRASIMAGSGVVGVSQVEREWKELNSKIDSVQEALGI